MMPIILDPKQREVYDRLMEIKAISKICEKNTKYWIDQIKATLVVLSNIPTTKGDKVTFKPEQIVGYAAVPLSQGEKELESEIEKLQYRESVSDKMAYDMLKKSTINIAGLNLGTFEKAFYIILAELAENNIFNN